MEKGNEGVGLAMTFLALVQHVNSPSLHLDCPLSYLRVLCTCGGMPHLPCYRMDMRATRILDPGGGGGSRCQLMHGSKKCGREVF